MARRLPSGIGQIHLNGWSVAPCPDCHPTTESHRGGGRDEGDRGTKNQLALDVKGVRNTLFTPGLHSFAFGVDFTTNQTVSYSLAPDNSPRTTINVTRNSVRCSAAQADQVETGDVCRAVMRSGCPGLTFQNCMAAFFDNLEFTRDVTPECLAQNQAWDACQARTAPGTANWTCSPVPGFMPGAPACDPLLEDLFACEGF